MRILMVCLGNICRSPLAHGIMQYVVDSDGLDWQIDSAGTGDWHVGQAPDHRSIAVAKHHGIDISGQRAQHFTAELFDRYDRIFVMDKQNSLDVLRLAKNDEQRSKVALFLPNDIVPDPYYDDNMFEPVFDMVKERCDQLLIELKK
ncbi:low molecular weight protein-tyrosine-phosphatase [Sphingobacterium rhinopitheci]|uniref:low molecular weight protein-tyrosine-phosphatase n=1 Tax=Sphingobacterium rhinopitheci TaxID=2781960 RepID=UPI001F522243|nr:low molecular weight protein-tyrosine-phosphatase [Sphingobacterium rhinopitheci]MCI0921023.1 low molecular weight phosphotyrosine protein phosphatase [Sphingobacterium rhinopitheci]